MSVRVAVFLAGFAFFCSMDMLLAKPAGSVDTCGHSADMVQVLGVDLAAGRNRMRMQTLTREFAQCIDGLADASALNRELKGLSPGFSQGRYSHRLFFHWGFNGDPERSEALRRQIEASTDNEEARRRMWDAVKRSQGERNRRMMAAVGALGYCSRKEASAIAALLYDTHLLGDYVQGTEQASDAMESLLSLKKDIERASGNLGRSHAVLQAAFEKDLAAAYASALSRSNKAAAMLDCMKRHLPRILASYQHLATIIQGQ